MAAIRTTFGRRSRTSGTQVGVQVNTFVLDKLASSLNGEALANMLMAAGEPSRQQAYDSWAVLTGASRDSIELAVAEVGPHVARVVLQAGGEKLINDSRNASQRDYAPYLEFNGSPSGSQPAGVLRNAIYDREREIKDSLKQQLADYFKEQGV